MKRESGKILRRWFKHYGFPIETYGFITNIMKCRPVGNRTPTDEEADFCARRWLDRELEDIAPEAIVVLGRVAQRVILPYASIGEGGSISQNGIQCYYLHHPSYWGRMGEEEYVKERVAPYLKKWIAEWKEREWL